MIKVDVNFPKSRNLVKSTDAKSAGEVARDIIRARTRAGKGFLGGLGGTLGSLPPLRESSVERRRRFKGRKARGFRADDSNLTLTGRLLRSISVRRRGDMGILRISDTKATSRARRIRNSELVKLLEDRGFVFYDLSLGEIEDITDAYNIILQQRIDAISDD